jgi:hypothetical protein
MSTNKLEPQQFEEFVKTIKKLLNDAQLEVASQNYEPERFTYGEGVEQTYYEVLEILSVITGSEIIEGIHKLVE